MSYPPRLLLGDGTAGTLTVTGDMTLHPTSTLEYDLGTPDCTGTGCVDSDLINVGGNLTLDGVLAIADATGLFGFGPLAEIAADLHGKGASHACFG